MYSPNVHAIQVWSVWHAEPFYRGIGFKSVLETAESGKKPRPVEGEHGPLLMWTNDRLRLHEPVKTLRSVESLPNLKSRDSSLTLKSKDSMMSILGSGAYQHKKTNL
jgi:hypothetical protein